MMRSVAGLLSPNARKRSLLALLGFLALVVPSQGCTEQQGEVLEAGEVVLAFQTNMSIPKDVDTLGISVRRNEDPIFTQEYDITNPETRIPATLAVVQYEEADEPVTIRIWSRSKGKVKTLRSIVTTVPERRVAMLTVPIEWACEELTTDEHGIPENKCEDGMTCVGGGCVSPVRDPEKFADYKPELVFAGHSAKEGMCFDLQECFKDAFRITFNPLHPQWNINIPDLNWARLNLALEFPPGTVGSCDENHCLLLLDYDAETGWTSLANKTLKFAPGIAKALLTGKALSLLASDSCPRKTVHLPLCGPYSSVPNRMLPDGGKGGPWTGDASTGHPSDSGTSDEQCERPEGLSPDQGFACVHLDWHDKIVPSKDDETLDGKGKLFIGFYKDKRFHPAVGPQDPNDAMKVATPVEWLPGPDTIPNPAVAGDLKKVSMILPPGKYYVWAVLYDNSEEEDPMGGLAKVERGGAWIGGADFGTDVAYPDPPGLGQVRTLMGPFEVPAGETSDIHIEMFALRRLTVKIEGPSQGLLKGQNDPIAGWFAWRTFHTKVIPPDDPGPVGIALSKCIEPLPMSPQTFVLEGWVIGKGKHYVVGTLDGYGIYGPGLKGRINLFDLPPGSFSGAVSSGSPRTVGPKTYWQADDVVEFGESDYQASTTAKPVQLMHFETPSRNRIEKCE